ncbi:hypothetical protein HHL19_34260 [Streptomyces sp. R302]|nr:hypothetical protein [Streptomyces sp. R301]NML83575.1 hypothetical protein [Streptomyces sp. R302]
MLRTRLKMAATLTVVVLALTGFQTSSSGGSGGGKGGSGKSKSKSSKSGGGGGCSSDKKDNDDYEGSGSGSGSGGGSEYTAEPTATATATYGPAVDVRVVDCVKPEQKKRKGKPARKADTTATLRIVDEGLYSTTETYRVTLEFRNGTGGVVDTAKTVVTVEGGQRKDFEVKMTKPRLVDKVRKCVIREAVETGATPTASGTPSPSS